MSLICCGGRFASLGLVLAAAFVAPAASAAPPAPATPAPGAEALTPGQQERFARLMLRLGGPDYRDREAAQDELAEFCKPLAGRSFAALLAGRRHRDPEVAGRCSEVLRTLLGGLVVQSPLPDLMAGLPPDTAEALLAAVLGGRTDKAARDWFAGGDNAFPAGMRRAAAGMLCSFMDGNPEAAVAHCGFPFLRHGAVIDHDQLLAVWQGLAPKWPLVFGNLDKVIAFTADTVPAEAAGLTELAFGPGDRGVVFRFKGPDDVEGNPLKLVFVLRELKGKWRAVILSQ